MQIISPSLRVDSAMYSCKHLVSHCSIAHIVHIAHTWYHIDKSTVVHTWYHFDKNTVSHTWYHNDKSTVVHSCHCTSLHPTTSYAASCHLFPHLPELVLIFMLMSLHMSSEHTYGSVSAGRGKCLFCVTFFF